MGLKIRGIRAAYPAPPRGGRSRRGGINRCDWISRSESMSGSARLNLAWLTISILITKVIMLGGFSMGGFRVIGPHAPIAFNKVPLDKILFTIIHKVKIFKPGQHLFHFNRRTWQYPI